MKSSTTLIAVIVVLFPGTIDICGLLLLLHSFNIVPFFNWQRFAHYTFYSIKKSIILTLIDEPSTTELALYSQSLYSAIEFIDFR